MGFLTDGNTMGFEATKASTYHEEIVEKTKVTVDARTVVKRDGLRQLVQILRDATANDPHEILLWGDEVEMTCVELPDCLNQPPKLWMGAFDLVSKLQELEKRTEEEWAEAYSSGSSPFGTAEQKNNCHLEVFFIGSAWHPEMSRHMIEALPDPPFPFSGMLDGCVLGVEESMNARRRKVQVLAPQSVVATTITAFPGMGGFQPGNSASWISPATSDEKVSSPGVFSGSPSSRSRFIPDDIANPHPRFPTLVENIRIRRGGSYKIMVPIYQDVKTKEHPMWQLSLPAHAAFNRKLVDHAALITPNPIKDFIYMDSFAFGMGTSCLQVTVGLATMADARYLYDQYTVLAPFVLALTAATPAYRGLLAATDTRWSVIEQGCDCRTEVEEDPESPDHIPKSRYSSVSLYIANNDILEENDRFLNDSKAPINKDAFEYLIAEDLDPFLARHYAHLWIRQPLVIYDNAIFIDNETRNDHFENLNSTNWNSVRFKPPGPKEESMPFRVELRTAEIQLTDFENAAVASFSVVFARACVEEKWELYIPMTKNDDNMHRSWQMDAVCLNKFWFRTDISRGSTQKIIDSGEPLAVEMTMNEIMNGNRHKGWLGVLNHVLAFASKKYKSGLMTFNAIKKLSVFCEFLKARASGEIPTGAKYLRTLMVSHLHYNQDSVVTPSMASRAMTAAALVGAGYFSNDVSSMPPHLGRFVLDVQPLYGLDKTCGMPTSLLQKLRDNLFDYEGIGSGVNRDFTIEFSSADESNTEPVPVNQEASTPSTTDHEDSLDGQGSDLLPSSKKNGQCLLEWMISGGQVNGDLTHWIDRTCSIHAINQGLFQVVDPNGSWMGNAMKKEWEMTHPCCSSVDSGVCHHLLKRMLENGADLRKLTPTGFPCSEGGYQYACSKDIEGKSVLCHDISSPTGPFVSTLAEKGQRWSTFVDELENPETVPAYKVHRRGAAEVQTDRSEM